MPPVSCGMPRARAAAAFLLVSRNGLKIYICHKNEPKQHILLGMSFVCKHIVITLQHGYSKVVAYEEKIVCFVNCFFRFAGIVVREWHLFVAA